MFKFEGTSNQQRISDTIAEFIRRRGTIEKSPGAAKNPSRAIQADPATKKQAMESENKIGPEYELPKAWLAGKFKTVELHGISDVAADLASEGKSGDPHKRGYGGVIWLWMSALHITCNNCSVTGRKQPIRRG